MASRVQTQQSRSIRPTPSRRSNFTAGVPSVIYSQSAAEFRPPADYVGPGKSHMERPPDPSMNPKKSSLPVISVSKLDVQVAVPPSSKTSLPRVESECRGKKQSTLLKCGQVKSILRNMPSSFRKQFRSELRNKRPCKGSNRKFVHRDFHDAPVSEQAVLHGIILLGGNHRDMVEEVPQEPGTPPPLSGRKHQGDQTEIYLEDIADNETGFISTEMQCEPIYDEPLEAHPVDFEDQFKSEDMTCNGTQLDEWVFANLDEFYNEMSTNLADAVIMESLKQLQEEFELEALRKQHDYHKCLRNREMSILAKYKAAQKKYEEQKRYLESRQPWDQTLDQIIQMVGFDKIRDTAPLHFIGSQTNQAVYEHILDTMIPPINEQVTEDVARRKTSRNLLDVIIEDSVLKREAEYAGRMYIRDPQKKGSLATNSPREQSLLGEWEGEYDGEEYGQGHFDPVAEYEKMSMMLSEQPSASEDEEEGEGKEEPEKQDEDSQGEAFDKLDDDKKSNSPVSDDSENEDV